MPENNRDQSELVEVKCFCLFDRLKEWEPWKGEGIKDARSTEYKNIILMQNKIIIILKDCEKNDTLISQRKDKNQWDRTQD